jgi:hypothetical protein
MPDRSFENRDVRRNMRNALVFATPDNGVPETQALLDWYETKLRQAGQAVAEACAALEAKARELDKEAARVDELEKQVAGLAGRVCELEADNA